MKRGEKRADGLETVEIIKKFARKELEKYGSIQFNLDRVLRLSGVSRGSVYHHFGNRDGLITTLEMDISLARTMEEMAALRFEVEKCSTREEVIRTFAVGFTIGNSPAARQRRLRRVSSIAASVNNKALSDVLREAQIIGTAEFVDILKMAEHKGLIQMKTSPEGTAYLLQSMLLGRVLVDIAATSDIQDDWFESSMIAMKALLGLDDQ